MSFPTDATPIYRPADSVEFAQLGDVRATFTAPGSATNGEFGLFHWDSPPHAGGPSAHYHRTFSESFYILSGTIRLFDGSRWVTASSGDFLYVPREGVHAFRNDSDAAASMLILFAPAPPRERYFEELAEIAATGRTLSTEEWTELYARHDQYQVSE